MESLSVTILQTDIFWESSERNLNAIKKLTGSLKHSSDIIILPEMFNSGFTNNILCAEDLNGPAVTMMQEMAVKYNSVITGTVAIKNQGKFYNMLIWCQPDSKMYFFPKKHLFSPGKEHTTYAAGNEKPVFEYKNWKILPLICYDLRFPVWSRNEYKNNDFLYDLAIYTANWPATRDNHWQNLLQARAIENMCYVAGCNRTGSDGNNYSYKGNSIIIDPTGKTLTSAGELNNTYIHYTLSKTELSSYRRLFPVWQDWDKFSI